MQVDYRKLNPYVYHRSIYKGKNAFLQVFDATENRLFDATKYPVNPQISLLICCGLLFGKKACDIEQLLHFANSHLFHCIRDIAYL